MVVFAGFNIRELSSEVVEAALRLLESRLPGVVERPLIERAYARALRTGSWWRVPEYCRGLVYAALKSNIRVFRSPKVVSALRRALAWLELYSMRGLVVLAGISYGIPRGLLSLGGLLGKFEYIMYLGRRFLESYSYFYPRLRFGSL